MENPKGAPVSDGAQHFNEKLLTTEIIQKRT